MNADLVAAVVAAGGGVAVAGAVLLHEQDRERTMRAGRADLSLRFPAGLNASSVESALGGLLGLGSDMELVFETRADQKAIGHRMLVPAAVRSAVAVALRASMPAVRIGEAASTATQARATAALHIGVAHLAVLRADDPQNAAASLLGNLVGLGSGESVALRWALRPSSAPVVAAPEDEARRLHHRQWQKKAAGPGFRVSGLVLVAADSRQRASGLLEQLVSVLRGRALRPGQLRFRRTSAGWMNALPRASRRSGWLSIPELVPLLSWPLGDLGVPGLAVGAARTLPVPTDIAGSGRPLLTGRDSRGVERRVVLSPEAALHHAAIVGPTGTGKSALLARGILADLAAGYGGVLIDPKADLVDEVLNRVPPEQADRVVVLDPAANGPIPGLDLMGSGDPDLRSDVIVGALSAIYRDSWGQRSDYYGRLALRTLADLPGATLADFGRLFFEPAFRQSALASLTDPWLIGAWQSYEALSPGERSQHVQAPMAKVMALISRPAVRRVLAQPAPKLDIGRLLAERKWLLVNLAPGALGEPAARLLGAVVLYVVWSAIEARAAVAKAQRRPVFVYVDELSTLASLPFGFELLAERARGLGAGLVVSAQTLGRIPEQTRAALLGNVATLLTFRASADEASRLARELPGLSADDLQALGAFEVAARVGGGKGSAVAIVTGHTEPPLPVAGQATAIRQCSAERYGVDPGDIDAALRARFEGEAEDLGSVGRTRRTS
jgi:hypothetical protein